MARFQLDHNVSHQLALELRRSGHDVVTAWDLGLQEADDDVHLAIAADEARVFITHNGGDFRLLHKAWRRWAQRWRVAEAHAGILVVPQRPLVPIAELAVLLDEFLVTSAGRTRALANELYTYDRTAGAWLHEPVR